MVRKEFMALDDNIRHFIPLFKHFGQKRIALFPAHRALWSECPSEEGWHFRHFPL